MKSRPYGRWLMGAIYVGAGALHFVLTPVYQRIMPGYLPAPRTLVLFGGACEMAGGVAMFLPLRLSGTRCAAAWGLCCLLVAVWPANLWMAQHPQLAPGVPLWALWLRLPLQLPLIAWAWLYTRRPQQTARITR